MELSDVFVLNFSSIPTMQNAPNQLAETVTQVKLLPEALLIKKDKKLSLSKYLNKLIQ